MMKLNLENQLRKVISNDMEIKVIKLSKVEAANYEKVQETHRHPTYNSMPTGYNDKGDFVRNAYLVYLHQYTNDIARINLTNRKLYIEATFNSI